MERTQAFTTLRLDTTADGQMVSDAAAVEVEALNEAYGSLAPEARRLAVQSKAAPEASTAVPWLDAFAEWLSAEALRTRQRWPNRNPEIAMIGGGALVLMLAAIGAGASLIAVFVAMVVVLVAIWSPWRRVG